MDPIVKRLALATFFIISLTIVPLSPTQTLWVCVQYRDIQQRGQVWPSCPQFCSSSPFQSQLRSFYNLHECATKTTCAFELSLLKWKFALDPKGDE